VNDLIWPDPEPASDDWPDPEPASDDWPEPIVIDAPDVPTDVLDMPAGTPGPLDCGCDVAMVIATGLHVRGCGHGD